MISCNNTEKKKDQSAVKTGQTNTQDSKLEISIKKGSNIYRDFCMQCHLANGKGIPNNFPPLAGSNWLIEKRNESIHSVKFGQKGEISVNGVLYNGVMAPMGLSDAEVADVLNYVMNSWGNKGSDMITEKEVSEVSQ